MLDFGLVAEALRERGLLLETLAPHLVRPVKFLYPLKHRVWERLYAGAGRRACTTRCRRRPGTRRAAAAPAPDPARALRAAPALRKDALVGALQYYDAQVDDARHTMIHRPHRRRVRRARSRPGPGWSASCARASGSPAPGCADLEHDRDVRGPGPAGRSTPPACGPTRPRRWSASAASSTCARQQGHPPGGAARPDPVAIRADPAHREERAVRHPVGPALDHRHHRHRLDARQGAPGGERAATSTTCSTTSTRCCEHAAHPRPTSRASTPGCGRCCPASRRRTSKLSREHAVGTPRAGPGGGRRRQVHDLPGDGQGRRRRGRARAGRELGRRSPSSSPRTCRCWAPRAIAALWNAPQPLAADSGLARGPHRAPARPVRLAGRRGARARPRPTRRWASRWRAPTTTCAPRSSTRRPTRVPGTSTTCWPAAPGSRSRRSTAASTSCAEVAELMAPRARLDAGAARARGRRTTGAGRGRAGEPEAARRRDRRRAPGSGAADIVPVS